MPLKIFPAPAIAVELRSRSPTGFPVSLAVFRDRPLARLPYEDPTGPQPQGFDVAMLNQLAHFAHPAIAVIVPAP